MKLNRITNIKTRRSQRAALEGLNWPKKLKPKIPKPGHLNISKETKNEKMTLNNFKEKKQCSSRDKNAIVPQKKRASIE